MGGRNYVRDVLPFFPGLYSCSGVGAEGHLVSMVTWALCRRSVFLSSLCSLWHPCGPTGCCCLQSTLVRGFCSFHVTYWAQGSFSCFPSMLEHLECWVGVLKGPKAKSSPSHRFSLEEGEEGLLATLGSLKPAEASAIFRAWPRWREIMHFVFLSLYFSYFRPKLSEWRE